jgi:hypothetical protein
VQVQLLHGRQTSGGKTAGASVQMQLLAEGLLVQAVTSCSCHFLTSVSMVLPQAEPA